MQDLGSNLEQLRRELIGKLLKLSPKRRVKILTRLLQRNLNVHIAFEDIYDPHNMMAATRTIDAFGFQHVHIIFNRLAPFNPRKTGKKTSASANKWLSFHVYASEVLKKPTSSESDEKLYARSSAPHNSRRSRHPIQDSNKQPQPTATPASVQEFLQFARKNKFTLVATVLDADSQKLPEFTWQPHTKYIILFGNEHAGLSQELINASDHKIYIPMRGFVQSLNLSVSVGIVLYDYFAKSSYTSPANVSALAANVVNFVTQLPLQKLELLQTWLVTPSKL